MTILLGIDQLLNDKLALIQNQRVGLISNASAVTHSRIPTLDALMNEPNVQVAALFAPEHGFQSAVAAGMTVTSGRDARTRLPIYSLYGDTKRPTAEMLADLDVFVFDIQTVGARFFTYITTLLYVMEIAAQHQVRVIVCDRPNPIGGERVEGPVLSTEFASFVGPKPLPIRHGLTIGELALMYHRVWQVDCDLHVVCCQHWQRYDWYDDTGLIWIPPSPNISKLDTAIVYPGICLFEGTNLSEGRGTTTPFEIVGAPWLDGYVLASKMNALELPGIHFQPVSFQPTASKWAGQVCNGVQLHVLDRHTMLPITVALYLLAQIRTLNPDDFQWQLPHFDYLSGTDLLRQQIMSGVPVTEIEHAWQVGLEQFKEMSDAVKLYRPT
ncbi:MAG: DUF1343 domain-containing protein [Chloroflexota bacterium]